jgi:hypothetical protein
VANALVVFTPRSGSTIVGDLLAHKYNAVNLDEALGGQIRGPLIKRIPPDVRHCLDQFNVLKRGSKVLEIGPDSAKIAWGEAVQFYDDGLACFDQIAAKHSIVVKCYPTIGIPGVKIINWAIKNNFELYFTYRRSFEEQLYSYTLAECREKFYNNIAKAGKLKMPPYAGFLNTKGSTRVEFPPVEYPIQLAMPLIIRLCGIRSLWSSYYRTYGRYGKVLCYEDTIQKNDFSALGITAEQFKEYSDKDSSLRPSNEYVLGKQIKNWEQIVNIARNYHIEQDDE